MTRAPIPLIADDISAFARNLHLQLAASTVPGHLALLNMLARAAGFRNFQHLRAQTHAADRIATPPLQADLKKVETALRYFDATGRMQSWPGKTNLQHLCLWALWSRLPVATKLTERQISALLTNWHLFGDSAILRRTLAALQLVSREPDGVAYLRVEQPPPADAVALIRALHQRAP